MNEPDRSAAPTDGSVTVRLPRPQLELLRTGANLTGCRSLAAFCRVGLIAHSGRVLLAVIDSPVGAEEMPDAKQRARFRADKAEELRALEEMAYSIQTPGELLRRAQEAASTN